MNHVVCSANIITFQIATSFTTFCLERETKKNSPGQEHPARIGKIKRWRSLSFFLIKLGTPHTFGVNT